MLLEDEPPLFQPVSTQRVDLEPLSVLEPDNVAVGAKPSPCATLAVQEEAATEGSPSETQEKSIVVTFEQSGSLGIEFVDLSSPYVIAMVHERGLAYGKGLENGDKLVMVGAEVVEALDWSGLVERFTRRPVTVTFVRSPRAAPSPTAGTSALLSGFTNRMRSLGGTVAQQGLDLSSRVGSVGLDLGSKVGSVGLDLGNKVGGVTRGIGLNSAVGPVSSTLYNGLVETLQDTLTGGTRAADFIEKERASDSTSSNALDTTHVQDHRPCPSGPERPVTETREVQEDELGKIDVDGSAGDGLIATSSTRDGMNPTVCVSEAASEVSLFKVSDDTRDAPVKSGSSGASECDNSRVEAALCTDVYGTTVDANAQNVLASSVGDVMTFDEGPKARSFYGEAANATSGDGRNGQSDTGIAVDEGARVAASTDGNAMHSYSTSLANGPLNVLGAQGQVNDHSPSDVPVPSLMDCRNVGQDAEQPTACLPRDQELQARAREFEKMEATIREMEANMRSAQATSEHLNAELKEKDSKVLQLKVELESVLRQCECLKQDKQAGDSKWSEIEAELKAALTSSRQREQEALEHYATIELMGRQSVEAAIQQAARERTDLEAQIAQLRVESQERYQAHVVTETNLNVKLREVESALAESRRLREQESTVAHGQLEQLRFALSERERQLEEKTDIVSRKQQEVKSLLRQLAALGDGCELQQEAETTDEASEVATTFEVMFALEGPLGLEFQRLAAPYVVKQVHADRIATGLGITPGDELIMVAEEPVIEAEWPDLVSRLMTRPVVARFRRNPARQDSQEGSFISSVSSVGTSLLTKARSSVPGVSGKAGQSAEPQDSRLQSEVERLRTLLRARDEEVVDLNNRLDQQQQALRVLEAGDAAVAHTAQLAQEREALSQQVRDLQAREGMAQQQLGQVQQEKDRISERCGVETRLKEQHQQQVIALTERCNSLMTQFESLRATCQSLSLDSQQKVGLEEQVQQLMHMNAQWQQAHQSLSSESEVLRQRAMEVQQLQAEAAQLRQFQQVCGHLERQLHEADLKLEATSAEALRLQEERRSDQMTVHRLQALIESMEERGESQAGQLEAELMARSRECAALRREAEEQRSKVQELLRSQQDCREATEEGRALKAENETLKRDLAAVQQEQGALTSVVNQCIAKLERETRERPHLVDKRMVTQMLAAYLEQRDSPRQQQEIMAKMADLLGFTTAEREQVGLAQRRRSLLEQQEEPAGLADLTDRFVDFLFEESEGA